MARDRPPQALRDIVENVEPDLLASLDELELQHQRLARVPRCLAQFAGLRRLDLSHNLLQHLPSRLLASSLPELTELSVRANFLSDVAEVQLLGFASKLRVLDLRDNSLPGQETPLGIAYHLLLDNMALGEDALHAVRAVAETREVAGNASLAERLSRPPQLPAHAPFPALRVLNGANVTLETLCSLWESAKLQGSEREAGKKPAAAVKRPASPTSPRGALRANQGAQPLSGPVVRHRVSRRTAEVDRARSRRDLALSLRGFLRTGQLPPPPHERFDDGDAEGCGAEAGESGGSSDTEAGGERPATDDLGVGTESRDERSGPRPQSPRDRTGGTSKETKGDKVSEEEEEEEDTRHDLDLAVLSRAAQCGRPVSSFAQRELGFVPTALSPPRARPATRTTRRSATADRAARAEPAAPAAAPRPAADSRVDLPAADARPAAPHAVTQSPLRGARFSEGLAARVTARALPRSVVERYIAAAREAEEASGEGADPAASAGGGGTARSRQRHALRRMDGLTRRVGTALSRSESMPTPVNACGGAAGKGGSAVTSAVAAAASGPGAQAGGGVGAGMHARRLKRSATSADGVGTGATRGGGGARGGAWGKHRMAGVRAAIRMGRGAGAEGSTERGKGAAGAGEGAGKGGPAAGRGGRASAAETGPEAGQKEEEEEEEGSDGLPVSSGVSTVSELLDLSFARKQGRRLALQRRPVDVARRSADVLAFDPRAEGLAGPHAALGVGTEPMIKGRDEAGDPSRAHAAGEEARGGARPASELELRAAMQRLSTGERRHQQQWTKEAEAAAVESRELRRAVWTEVKGVAEPEAPPGATAEDAARLHRAVLRKGTVRGKGVTLPFGAMLHVQREQEAQEARLRGPPERGTTSAAAVVDQARRARAPDEAVARDSVELFSRGGAGRAGNASRGPSKHQQAVSMERAVQRDFERSHAELQQRLEAIRQRPNSILVAVQLKGEVERREARAGAGGLQHSARASERVAAILQPYPDTSRAEGPTPRPEKARGKGHRAGTVTGEALKAAPHPSSPARIPPRAMRKTGLWLSDALTERELELAQRECKGMRPVEAVDQLRRDAASLKISHADLTRECTAIRRRAQANERQRALSRNASVASREGKQTGSPAHRS